MHQSDGIDGILGGQGEGLWTLSRSTMSACGKLKVDEGPSLKVGKGEWSSDFNIRPPDNAGGGGIHEREGTLREHGGSTGRPGSET